MGGYLAARWAQLHPERVERLFLMCPAFNFVENLKGKVFGDEEKLKKWVCTKFLSQNEEHKKKTKIFPIQFFAF